MTRKPYLVAGLLLTTALLSGCEARKEAEGKIATSAQQADKLLLTKRASIATEDNGIDYVSEPFYGATGATRRVGQYDPVLDQNIQLITSKGQPMSLREVAREIEARTGVLVRLEGMEEGRSPTMRMQPLMGNAANPASIQAVVNAVQTGGGVAPISSGASFPYSHDNKPLRELMTLLETQHGIDWSVAGNPKIIKIFQKQTKTWTLTAPIGETKVNVSFDGGEDSGGGIGSNQSGPSGTSTSSTSTKFQSETTYTQRFWDGVEKTLGALIEGQGTLTISPDTWTITAKAPPQVIQQIDRYIGEINDRLTRQVEVRVTIYTVNVNKVDDYGLDVRAAFQDLNDNLRLLTAGPVNGVAAAAGSISGAIVDDDGPLRAFRGSQIIARALSTLGETSTTYDKADTTQSGAALFFQEVRKLGYVAQVAPPNQSIGTGNASTSIPIITPGSVSIGYKNMVMPRVLADGTIQIETSISDSTLNELRSVAQGPDISIEVPDTDKQDTSLRRFFVTNGVPYIFSSWSREVASKDDAGVGFASIFSPFGGRKAGATRKRLTLMTVTATIEPRPGKGASTTASIP